MHKLRLSNYRLWSILISCAVVIGLCLYVPNYVHAAINKQINFQGKVTNTNGTNVSNGSYSFTFSIYTVSSGGSPVWSETKSLTVTDGIFRTALGDSVALPGSVNFDTDTLYLGVTFHTDTEMSPRIRLTAVPYAFNSDTLDGLDSTALLRSNTSTSYSSGTLSFSTGTTLDVNAGATLDVNGGLSIADTDVTFDGGNTSFDINGAGTRTLTIYNSTSAQVADLDLADGDLKTGGTSRLTNGGALQNITGYAQSSGNFAISGTGTFGTGTGAVSLNGDTTIASGKLFRITGGSGDPTATSGVVWYDTTANKFKVVENGTVKVLCNTTDAGCGAGGSPKWNTIQAPDGAASLSMGTNGTTFTWGQTTTNAFTNTFDSLSSGKGLYLSSSSTSMSGNMMELALTGSGAGNTGNVVRTAVTGASSTAVPLMVTNLGAGASFRVNDETGDTDTTPFIIDASGNVGIGDATPTYALTVGSSDAFGVTSSGYVLAPGGTLGAGTLSYSFTGDTNTGIYSSGSDVFDIVAGGVRSASFTTAASGVNYVQIAPAAAGSGPTISAVGGSTDVPLSFASKGTGKIDFTSANQTGTTTSSGFVFNANSVNTGTGMYVTSSSITQGKLVDINTGSANTLSSGVLLNLASQSTALSSGGLLSMDWSPGSATTATGDLFSLNIGPNGNVGYIMNIKDNGGTVFGVSESQITSALPHQFTAAGDVGVAYDIVFSNPSASFIKSQAPLSIVAGETFNSSDLNLQTYNNGNIVLNSGGTTMVGTTGTPNGRFLVDGAYTGKSLVIFNETGDQNILTASASGTTVFNVGRTGNLTVAAGGSLDTISAGALTIAGTNANALTLGANTTIASGKLFRITGGSGDPTATSGVVWYDTTANKFKVVENGTVKILCNTTDAGCGAGGSAKWNTIQAPDGAASLSMGTNGTTFTWGQTTTNAFTNTFDSLSSGKGLYLSSSSTSMSGNMMELALTGSGAGNTGNVIRTAVTGASSTAVPLMVTNLGAGASFRVNDETGDTDTTPFIIDASGNVGIGQASATQKLEVTGNVKIQTGNSLLTDGITGITSSVSGINLADSGMTLASYLNVKYALDNDNGDTNENFQVVTNGSQRLLFTVDESGLLTLGGSSTQAISGSLKFHSEQGVTDYYTLFQTSGAQTQNVTYTLPNDDGNTGQFLTTNGTGTLSWTSAGAWTASGNDIYYTAGKVGVGTSSLTEALNVGGNILIGAQADNTSSVALVNGTAGTYGAQSNIDGAYSSVVFNGKLYVGTKETDNAGVYRYDGGGSWTLVSNAAGKVVSGDAQDIDAITLTVFNGKLYAGTRTGAAGTGAVYEYNGSTWTMITSARGTVGAETARDGVYDLHVWNNRLYAVTEEANASGLYRFDGGTTWTRLNATVGKGLAETTADIDAGVLIAYGGRLWWGTITGAATARVYMYDGNTFTLINTTAGTFATGTTGVPDVSSMAVYAGQLFIGTGQTTSSTYNLANVYVYKGGVPGAAGANVFLKLTATSGRVDATNDATDVDYISAMKTYNGRLYVGSSTSATGNAGGLYEYNGINAFTTIGTRGTFGAQTNVDQVDSLIEFNGTLYVGTEDSANNTGSIYSFTKTLGNSYGLNFDSGSGNYGELSFVGGTQSQDNAGHMGTFLLSHPLASTTGAFDYAEDYPTFDESVEAGDIVSIDPIVPEYVRKGSGGMEYVGIVSENPGFRLQQTGEKANEARYVPVALVGRVPVKVSTESGQIYPGDYLTGSSVAGVAMKAVKGGAVIGQAMEGYSQEGIGKIIVFVQNTHILGGSVNDLLGPSTVGVEKMSGVDEELQVLAALNRSAASQKKTEVIADRIAATHDIIAPTVIANTLIVDTIKANRIEGLEMIAGKLTTLDAAVASVAARFSLSPTEATSGALLNADQLVGGAMGGLTVTGTATISGDLRVSGNSLIEGILNVIDTITTPRLIVGNWASFMGKVLFREDVEFAGRPTFNADTAGYVLIKAGSREASVHFDKPYEERPVVSASFVIAPTDVVEKVASDEAVMAQSYQFAVKEVSEKGFTVVLNKPAKETVQLSWIALAVRKQTQGQVLSTESTWRDRVSSLSAELSVTPSPLPSPSSFFLTTPIATGEGVIQN